jgi:hypothetical protein
MTSDISEYHVTTKRTKDTKDSEIITFQFLNFVLPSTLLRSCFTTSFENTARKNLDQLKQNPSMASFQHGVLESR